MFVLFLMIGMLLMFFCMWYGSRFYNGIKLWKVVAASVLLTGMGVLGAYVMFWIETGGQWSGRSFYGAVFLPPLLMFPAAKILKMNYGELMDLSAPAECIMLALLKLKCLQDGCCGGRCFQTKNGTFQFPSQIVECVVAIILMVVLLYIMKRGKNSSQVYPIYMVLYGVTRFILNLFRETTPWIGSMPAGNFWSLVSVVLGVMAFLAIRRAKSKNNA